MTIWTEVGKYAIYYDSDNELLEYRDACGIEGGLYMPIPVELYCRIMLAQDPMDCIHEEVGLKLCENDLVMSELL